jgi:hypothetical protein
MNAAEAYDAALEQLSVQDRKELLEFVRFITIRLAYLEPAEREKMIDDISAVIIPDSELAEVALEDAVEECEPTQGDSSDHSLQE